MGVDLHLHTSGSNRKYREAKEQLEEKAQKKQQQPGRFAIFNVWRNISETPIQDWPLAMLDERSIVNKSEDLIQIDDMKPMNLLNMRKNYNYQQQKWYYFPEMQKDEVLLFKQYDSDTSLSGRQCFHTAIDTKNGDPTRETIEVRVVAYFD